ncbi:DUF4402 domain-containing protein [Sphingorhabdus sp. YGSMI21]|uniref:DUF4402 domain-containing protein n=1 Tax=Sphingorhabdus sp. YGSMI21 TaxID=2077182 RepID=UPI000C1F36E1|nr:DUF4402 domain-containing protein [Sphingorhabdus sp. YGSMI21]ATW02989.1 hypothetical protein CHN51_05150 [Sphingorhabdus sp. YGSMI21]
MTMVVKSLLTGAMLMASLAFPPASLQAQCRLCAASGQPDSLSGAVDGRPEIPLQIEITANLDFSRMALLSSSGGVVSIDPMSGDRQIRGSIANLGGMALHGEGRLTGEPGRSVRIFLPERIQLSAPNGSTAELERLETNLPALARLDPSGRLTFAFGGQLRIRGDASGRFRGRIAITADYE